MNLKVILGILFLLAVLLVCVLVPDPDRLSVEKLKDVATFVHPEAYYDSSEVDLLYDTAQHAALLPTPPEATDHAAAMSFKRQPGFVGPDRCKECHADYYQGFVQTAHYRTSALASESSIRGSFEDRENVMETRAKGFRYRLTKEENEFFQSLLVDRNGETYQHKRRFDIVTGSGNIGQTYLYWQGDSLFQLPVSWFSKSGWINSPGFSDGLADFARPIKEDCMACHSTLVEYAENRTNVVDKRKMILGVTCERCHGPAESHVNFHRENPQATDAKFITHPGDLSRERTNDICSQCHSGAAKSIQSPYSFRPGDSIHQFKRFPPREIAGGGTVHTANQNPRMRQSKCYTDSDTMSCATCHNPHQHEHGNLKLFSDRCMKCHQPDDCGQFSEHGNQIRSNCIDCHMPKEDDMQLKIETTSEVIFPKVRDHFIRIDAEATRKFLKSRDRQGD